MKIDGRIRGSFDGVAHKERSGQKIKTNAGDLRFAQNGKRFRQVQNWEPNTQCWQPARPIVRLTRTQTSCSLLSVKAALASLAAGDGGFGFVVCFAFALGLALVPVLLTFGQG